MLKNELVDALRAHLQGRQVNIDKDDNLWDAAVLVPLLYEASEPYLLFEVRAQNLHRQPGQICFPGGHYEASDKNLAATALRETCEELGLQEANIEVLGELDTFVTHAGPVIHPFIGVLHEQQNIIYNKTEVAEVFTVPLKFLLETKPIIAHVQVADKPMDDFPFDLVPERQRDWRQQKGYNVYFYKYKDKVIWGMTARILHSFLEKYRGILSGTEISGGKLDAVLEETVTYLK